MEWDSKWALPLKPSLQCPEFKPMDVWGKCDEHRRQDCLAMHQGL